MAETETRKWHVAVSDQDGDIEWLHCHCTDGKHTRLKEILWRDEGADYLNALEACAEALETIVHGLSTGWWGEGSGEMEDGELQQAEEGLARLRDLRESS